MAGLLARPRSGEGAETESAKGKFQRVKDMHRRG